MSSQAAPNQSHSPRIAQPRAQRPFHRLVINTDFSRHHAQAPREITSLCGPEMEDPNSIGMPDENAYKATTNNPIKEGSRRNGKVLSRLGKLSSNPNPSKPDLLPDRNAVKSQTQLGFTPRQSSLRPPLLHRRIAGLRLSPLDLNQDISPSDRSIPIGIAVRPPGAGSLTVSPPYYSNGLTASRGDVIHPNSGKDIQDAPTPTIVVTPAEDEFGPEISQEEYVKRTGYRATSSIYSRYTNCGLDPQTLRNIPEVPPLPIFSRLVFKKDNPRESSATTFEEDAKFDQMQNLEVESSRDLPQDKSPPNRMLSDRQPRSAGPLTSRSSRGWWNIITSPFSGKSSNSFWRSPSTAGSSPDSLPILRDASVMGICDPHTNSSSTNESCEPRSAPASGKRSPGRISSPEVPKRASTAPGPLDINDSIVNIYRIPSQGAAAAYYDLTRHFPSLVLSPEPTLGPLREIPDEYEPVDGVAEASRKLAGGSDRDDDHEETSRDMCDNQDPQRITGNFDHNPKAENVSNNATNNPTRQVADAREAGRKASPNIAKADRGIFSTPTASELGTVKPQTAPIITPPQLGLGTVTMSNTDGMPKNPLPFSDPRSVQHTQQDSFGLGISCGKNSGKNSGKNEKPQLREPDPEKFMLRTDRFGQLTTQRLEDQKPPEPWHRRFLWSMATLIAFFLMILIASLVVFLPLKHNDMSIEAQWLNLTGFPPIPTGIATLIQPRNAAIQNSCVSPSNLWTCTGPEQQSSGKPNFRFEIRFRNGTLPSNVTAQNTSATLPSKRSQPTGGLQKRSNFWTEYLFRSFPSPPSQNDQIFLGHTTDNNSFPYNGEATPFYISLLNAAQLKSVSLDLHKRNQDQSFQYPYPNTSDEPSTNASTSATQEIPALPLAENGEPFPEELYPYVLSQPLRLFNRGQPSEHYGFYAYFDRSVYISEEPSSGNATGNHNNNNISTNIPLADASAVCTWSQTRLLVQIWTRGDIPMPSLPAAANNSSALTIPALNSTANDMSFPGSFPYPVTITLDRHGGRADQKGVYCYGLDEEHHLLSIVKTWVPEDRSKGGSLVNPAQVPGGGNSSSGLTKRLNEGGVDGGTGGCLCQWENWS